LLDLTCQYESTLNKSHEGTQDATWKRAEEDGCRDTEDDDAGKSRKYKCCHDEHLAEEKTDQNDLVDL